eukprot:7199603-Prymnesium_polylepis.2
MSVGGGRSSAAPKVGRIRLFLLREEHSTDRRLCSWPLIGLTPIDRHKRLLYRCIIRLLRASSHDLLAVYAVECRAPRRAQRSTCSTWRTPMSGKI